MKTLRSPTELWNLEYLVGHSVMNQRIYDKRPPTFSTLHSIFSTWSFTAFSRMHVLKFFSSHLHSSLVTVIYS